MARTGRPPSLGWYEVATFYEAVEQLKARGVPESAAFKAATDTAMSRGAAQYRHRKGKEIIQAKNAALRPLEDAVRPLANAMRPLANAVRPLANAVRPLHDAVRPLHDAVRPLVNAVGPLANAVRPLHDAVRPLHDAVRPLANAFRTVHAVSLRLELLITRGR